MVKVITKEQEQEVIEFALSKGIENIMKWPLSKEGENETMCVGYLRGQDSKKIESLFKKKFPDIDFKIMETHIAQIPEEKSKIRLRRNIGLSKGESRGRG